MNIPTIVSMITQLGRPVHIKGEPGIGKTAFVQELATKLGYHLETMIASNHEPSDITGLPYAEDGFAHFLPVPMIRRIKEADERGIPTILFLDEISTAPPAMQAACLRLLHEGMAGDFELPKSTLFILASNPAGTSQGVFQLSGAMANRMFHFDWPVSAPAWSIGMIQGFDKAEIAEMPKDWKKFLPEARMYVSSFIGVNQDILLKQPEEQALQAEAWPSPRTWDFASEALAAIIAMKLDENIEKDIIMTVFSSVVGEGAAMEFSTWYDNRDLRKPEEYLKDPKNTPLPTRSDQIFATLNSIVSYCIHQDELTRPMWKAAWEVLGRVAKDNKADFAAIPAQILVRNRPKGYQIPATVARFMPALNAAGLIKKEE